MHRMAADAQTVLRREYGPHATVHVYKNNVDSAGHSFGCHENYLVRRDIPLDMLGREFVPFLVTRQLYAGAGTWDADGNFQLSQRADFLDDAIDGTVIDSLRQVIGLAGPSQVRFQRQIDVKRLALALFFGQTAMIPIKMKSCQDDFIHLFPPP